jgi:hypothetical protein
MPTAFTTKPTFTADGAARDLRSRCAAAARLAMAGDRYSPEDRADCAAAVMSRYLTGAYSAPLCGCGGPALVRYLVCDDLGNATDGGLRCYRHAPIPAQRRELTARDRWSAIDATFTALFHDAADYRRSVDAQRARDDVDAAARAAHAAFLPNVQGDTAEVRGTPWGARVTALDMLRLMGELKPGQSPSGPAWTAAYCAARAAAGMDAGEVAEEMEMDAATVRQHLKRASDRIGARLTGATAPLPGTSDMRVSRTAHRAYLAQVIGTPEPIALKATATRQRAAGMGEDTAWRTRPETAAPITARIDTAAIGAPTAPDWTTALPRPTAQRLETAARLRRARAATRDDAQREQVRRDAGIPSVVR